MSFSLRPFDDHLETFGPYRVTWWEPGDPLPDVETTVPRLAADDGARWAAALAALLTLPGAGRLRGLVVGDHANRSAAVVAALAAAAPSLPDLHVLFFGDITQEESEISWVESADLSPLLAAFPGLTHLGVRGTAGLSFGRLALPRLEWLAVQGNATPGEVVREVARADLPALRHLELYLGEEGWGGDSTPEDLSPLFGGEAFPALRSLGLRNAEQADELAGLLASSPLLGRLETIDFSLGTLSDEGANALAGSPDLREGTRLVVHHHFLSGGAIERLVARGVDVDHDDGYGDERDWRFVAITE